MAIRHEWQYVFQCDACGASDSMAGEVRDRTIRQFRKAGWKIDGKRVLCPECKERRKNEKKEGCA